VFRQFAEARFGEGVPEVPDLDGAGINRNNLSTLGFEHLQGVVATEHRIEQRAFVGLDSPLDQHFIGQSEAEEMNAPSFADALVVQALGGSGGGVQGRITSGTREIVLSDGETVG